MPSPSHVNIVDGWRQNWLNATDQYNVYKEEVRENTIVYENDYVFHLRMINPHRVLKKNLR